MNKKCLCLLLALLLLMTGCARDKKPEETGDGTPGTNTQIQEAGTEDGGSAQMPGDPDAPGLDTDPSLTAYTVTTEDPYASNKAELSIIGFQRYDTLQGRNFTDTPRDGYCYLVLFLSATNYESKGLYMSPDETLAAVDDRAISSTFLLNEPGNYNSFFNMIPAGNSLQGYIVWEVPADWLELKVQFLQWKNTEQVRLEMILTPADYFEPPEYDPYRYGGGLIL